MAELAGVVVPIDGSTLALRALPVAADVARRVGGRVVLVTSRANGEGATPAELEDLIARVRGAASVTTRTTVVLSTPWE